MYRGGMRSAPIRLALTAVVAAGCAAFPSLDYLEVSADADADAGAGAGGDASVDAGGTDARTAADGEPSEASPPDSMASDAIAAPLHCFGGSVCMEGQACCMRVDYSSGYCTDPNSCLNDTFVCDKTGYCTLRGLGPLCCATGDDAGTLSGSSCTTTCGGQRLCDPLIPDACPSPLSCVRALNPANYFVCQ